jgi:hypothetical protein
LAYVLVACEFSGIVREAFRFHGHDAWSCDLLSAEDNSMFHAQCDVREILRERWRWDLMIAHPPCTHLSVSGARWFKDKQDEQAEALEFVRELLAADIPYIALENPIGYSAVVVGRRCKQGDLSVAERAAGTSADPGACPGAVC